MRERHRTGTMQRSPGSRLHLRGIAALVSGAVALLALAALVATPGNAVAAAGPDAQYYQSTLTDLEPAVPGIDFMVHDNQGSVMLTNATGTHTVTVVGYSGEDYLRITPTKVFQNVNSLTAALNAGDGTTAPPARLTTGKKLPAKWKETSPGNSVLWRDVRVRWTGDARPPIVQADPHSRHQVFPWAIQLKVDDQPVLVRGELTWTGTPVVATTSHYPMAIALGAAGLLLLLALIVLASRRRRTERDRARPEPEYSTSRFIGARH